LSEPLSLDCPRPTDGLRVYFDAVSEAFGNDIDYGMLVKIYGASPESAIGSYSPAECIGCKKSRVARHPERKHISTSYVERSNLSMRMGMRRFTRLTNAFSKKLENHFHALALYFTFYDFVRIHKTPGVTPAKPRFLLIDFGRGKISSPAWMQPMRRKSAGA
jgi:hypothetical protein